MPKTFSLVILVAFLSIGASNCSIPRLMPDTGMSALDGGDSTAFIEGCGHQPIPGYTYCRQKEGDVTGASLWAIAPPAECLRESCVSVKFYKQGGGALEYSFPKGVTRLAIKWKDILDRDTFVVGDRGFWPFDYRIYWVDKDKREQLTFVDGEIRLVVFKNGYEPLHEATSNPNFVWSWTENNCVFSMTTGGRASVFCDGVK